MKPLIAAATTMMLTLPLQAQEELLCMPTAELEAGLIDWYNETPVQQIEDRNHIVWASGVGGTWTIVSYEPNDISCTIAQGDNWSPMMNGDALLARLESTGS